MSLSVQAAGQASQVSRVQTTQSPTADLGGGTAKKPTKHGSTPAAVLSISAQAKAAQAKALAIKTGHDPDGVQDGK